MEQFMHAVFFRYRSGGSEATTECWEKCLILRFLRHQPQATVTFSRRTCSCSEHQQVISCTSATNERVWECRRKRKEPEMRASGQVGEAPLRVDKHVNT